MCGRTILPPDISNHPRCENCGILLEPELNEKALRRCGRYHNLPSVQSPTYRRACMGEEIPTGTPSGEPVQIEEELIEFEEELETT